MELAWGLLATLHPGMGLRQRQEYAEAVSNAITNRDNARLRLILTDLLATEPAQQALALTGGE